ncbi:MAG TPA: DUF2726 domain-containing protein [Tepidisphaeraceae bacterium]|nr:DUF2726 domain-containing protein [Tepidisphaeraceae bacterium]
MPSQFLPLIIAIACLVLLIGLLKILVWRPKPLPYFSREFLLSKGELVFYQSLRRAVPQHLMICPKVRLADVIHCSGEAWKEGFGGRISQKHLDFIIADASTTAICVAIELDDKSHRQARRQERDQFVDRALAAARVPLIRVPATAVYDAKALSNVLRGVIDSGAPVDRLAE